MNVKFNNSNQSIHHIPRVGQAWKHERGNSIYMRIPDSYGKIIFPDLSDGEYFFSVNLYSGYIAWVPISDSNSIILLADRETVFEKE